MAFSTNNDLRNLKRAFIKTAMKGRRDFLDHIKAVTGITTKVTLSPDITHQIIYDIDGGTFWIHIGTSVTAGASTDWAELK